MGSYMAANPNMSLRNIIAGMRASVSTKEVGDYMQTKAQKSSRVIPINITKAARVSGVESALNYEEGCLGKGGNASKKVHFEDDDPLVEEDEDTEEDCENPIDGDLQK